MNRRAFIVLGAMFLVPSAHGQTPAASPLPDRPVIACSCDCTFFRYLGQPEDLRLWTSTTRPDDFYVTGKVSNGVFVPEGEVQGRDDLGQSCEGREWYIDLGDGALKGPGAAHRPSSPHAVGCMDTTGRFIPSTRTIGR